MAERFADAFYSSVAWQNCREAYKKYRKGLCEVCLSKGIYTSGEIVHHKKHITPRTIDDPNITLNWDNLLLVCRECHADQHRRHAGQRYKFDRYGNCIIDGEKHSEVQPEET